MRPLPLNAAAASGATPEGPARFGSAPFASSSAHARLALVLGGAVERGRADEIARVDRARRCSGKARSGRRARRAPRAPAAWRRSRSRASSEAPASSRRRASGTQPESAAENSSAFNCAEMISALRISSRRSSSRQVAAGTAGADATPDRPAHRQAVTSEPEATMRQMTLIDRPGCSRSLHCRTRDARCKLACRLRACSGKV